MPLTVTSLAALRLSDSLGAPEGGSNLLYMASVAAGTLYLAITGLAAWRQKSRNVTPVSSAPAESGSRPDFLKVDQAARAAALQRGSAFEEQLRVREAEAASAAVPAALAPAEKSFCIFAFLMSAFTLVSMLFGSIWQITWIGRYAEEFSAKGRLVAIVKDHPIAFTVALAVCVLQVVRFVREKRQR